MAVILTDLDGCIGYLNTLYNISSTPPTSGEEDYLVWTSLFNIAKSLWEKEGLWKELVVDLANAADGDKTTTTATSYDLPSLFRFPMTGIVWLGTGTDKTDYPVIDVTQKQLYENNSDNWCYFLNGKLYFNPNLSITAAQTINYTYYKYATKLTTGADLMEMSDPMFAVYFALSELKKDEGDTAAGAIATQKLAAMKTQNASPAFFQTDNLLNQTEAGFGTEE